ncbi:MAG TPA: response regulator transcription factor [Flavipsychrobacter sp.]|nr:response regulator transcription factor [Flavipsychrobacter sp.]
MTGINIAIADDHEMVRMGLSTLIESFEGFRVVIQAGNGQELLEKIERAVSMPAICVVDVSMPVMNGYDTVAAIKGRWPEIKILALTMLDNEFCVVKMIANGADGYILKGDNSGQLKKALLALYDTGSYYSDLISNKLFHAIQTKSQQSPALSEKEVQVLRYVCSDLTYVQIGEKMGISARSVESYRDSLFVKFKVNSRVSLALFALRLGIVPFH